MGFFTKVLGALNVITYIGTATGSGYSENGVTTAHNATAIGILGGKKDFIFSKNDIASLRLEESNKIIEVQGKEFIGNVYTVNFKNGNVIILTIKESYCQVVEKILN